jgi:predicted transposase/invertase (TIGR01784 family)
LFILSEIGTFTPEQYSQYMKSLKDMSDYYNIIDTAAEEAEKRGLAKGLEQGRAEESRSIALRLLEMGLTIEQVAQATTLSIEEINQLKS